MGTMQDPAVTADSIDFEKLPVVDGGNAFTRHVDVLEGGNAKGRDN